MKLPRPSTRRLMILVALAGLALGLVAWMHRRADRFRAEAGRHARPMGQEILQRP